MLESLRLRLARPRAWASAISVVFATSVAMQLSDGTPMATAQGTGTPAYTVVDLGTWLPTQDSLAEGINEAGDVVGWATAALNNNNPGQPIGRAFVFRQGALQDLGTLGAVVPAAYTACGGIGSTTLADARAINALGQIVGVSLLEPPTCGAGNPSHAFLWQAGRCVTSRARCPTRASPTRSTHQQPLLE